MLLVFAIIIPGILLLFTLSLDVGNWYQHRRHLQLQTDAAALAAGLAFQSCATTAGSTVLTNMEAIASQYGGDTARVANPYNRQAGQGAGAGNVLALGYQTDKNGNPVSDTNPCTSGVFDVRATETAIPNIFRIAPLATVHAHSRVEMKAINELKGLLPLAVQDVRPAYVFATFVDQNGNAVLCSGSPCQIQLFADPTNTEIWRPDPNATLPSVTIPVGGISVRLRLVSGNNPNLTCGQLYTECYDATTSLGVSFVRGWNSSTPSGNTIWVKDASMSLTDCSGTGTPYYTTADCSTGLAADVDLRNRRGGATLTASIDGSGAYPLTTANPNASGTQTWQTADGAIPISGEGAHVISLNWKCTSCSGNPKSGTVGNVVTAFEGGPNVSDGVGAVSVYKAGASLGPYTFQAGDSPQLGVQIQTFGQLLVSKPTDAPIYLRVFKEKSSSSASQNQSLDCDKDLPNFEAEIAQGCAPFFIKNPSLQCPGGSANNLWNIWYVNGQPLPCVLTQTGAAKGQVSNGFNERIFGTKNPGNGTCSQAPVNWIRNVGFDENAHPNDPRALPLIVTPLGTFSGNGNDQIPVIDFAYFYVTGYSGDPCQGQDPNEDPVPNNRGAEVRGHFIKYFPLEDIKPSDNQCDLTALTPCVAVLTR